MIFTPHQERALDLKRHLAVTANAGSGKTQVLVERYVRLLLAGAPVGDVVALTYTDKAASALRRKIAGRITSELLAAGDPSAIARLESIRDSLPSAFVGTIHSFCARVLREYPVEAGIDAAFTMLEGVDAAVMLRECTAGVIGEVLRGGKAGIPRERCLDLIRSLGRLRLLRVLDGIVSRPDMLERFLGPRGVYAGTDEEVLALWEGTIRGEIGRGLNSPGLIADLENIVAASAPKLAGEAAGALGRIRAGGDLADRAGAFVSLAAMVFTKAGEIQKKFLAEKGSAEYLAGNVARIGERRRLLDPLIGALLADSIGGLHRTLLADTRVLLALAHEVVAGYALRKAEDARLDFDDLQLKMRRLLADDGVRADLSGRFRYVMVDEYQDTNTLQLEILLPLLQDLSSGNLMIVGDPKQSIYRFRDADVEVFDRSRRAIGRAAGDESLVGLGESFRPLRDIVAFVNLLFGGIMGEGEMTSYDPLVRARQNEDPGGVEIILPLSPEEGGSGQEDLVARRILRLAAEGTIVYGRDETPRPMSFRDIALLLRSRNGLEDFEQAFIRNGVPYVVSGGVGYFQTQDVVDMYNYLRFLLDTSDDIALAGILRSPFFTVSDAELFELARRRGERTLWDALRGNGPVREIPPSLAHASRVLEGDLLLGTRLPAAELIAAIDRRTGFTAALAGTVRGAQAKANIGKLLAMARSYESQGFRSLYDFVGRLERLIEEEEKEGQAGIESQTDAVRVMTIHAAKGLEFPVVIVADLQRKFQSDREPFLDPTLGIGLSGGEAAVRAPLSEYLKDRSRRKSEEEEQRIFYVACTRARDRLLLAGGADPGSRSESWLGWLDRCCRDHGQDLLRGPLVFTSDTPVYDGTATRAEPHTLTVPVTRTLTGSAPAGGAQQDVRVTPRIDIAPVPSRSKGEIFSASRIRTYVECPAKYFFRYVLGLAPGGGPFAEESGEEFSDGEYPAELRGRVFHAVMQSVDALPNPSVSLDEAVRGALAREAPFTAAGYPALITDTVSLVRSVIESGSWKEISRGTDVRTEYSISAALGEDFITGTIDRLYRAPDGLWTVLDYKTDSVTVRDIPGRAKSYWAQLDFYALMVHRLCSAPSVRTRLLFAHHPEILVDKVISPEDIIGLESDLARVIARIKNLEFPSSHPSCSGCPASPGECLPG